MDSQNFQTTLHRGLWAVLCAFALFGCSGNGDKKPAPQPHDSGSFAQLSAQAPEVLGTKPVPAGGPVAGPDTSWSIVIASATGPDAEPMAQAALEKVRTVGGLPRAYIEHRGKAAVVAYGQYASGSSKEAQADLERLHTMVIDGQTPFANAILTPPPFEALPGSIPEYDLSTAKQRFGKNALYTLQVACYERADGGESSAKDLAEFRAAAEKAAIELRREGEEAFYFHGPRRSMVTVGLYGNNDVKFAKPSEHGQGEWIESMAVKEAKRRHPLNLVNGEGIKVKVRGQTEGKLQPSFIVAVPN